MKKFIAKPDTWYDAGTEVKLVEWICKVGMNSDMDYGLFQGLRNGVSDGETCTYDEFDIIEVCKCGHDFAAHWNGNDDTDLECFYSYNCDCEQYEE